MKQFEKIIEEMSECESAMELAGFLDGIRAAAIVYCKHNCPDEIDISSNGKINDLSIYGMAEFLDSKTESPRNTGRT